MGELILDSVSAVEVGYKNKMECRNETIAQSLEPHRQKSIGADSPLPISCSLELHTRTHTKTKKNEDESAANMLTGV